MGFVLPLIVLLSCLFREVRRTAGQTAVVFLLFPLRLSFSRYLPKLVLSAFLNFALWASLTSEEMLWGSRASSLRAELLCVLTAAMKCLEKALPLLPSCRSLRERRACKTIASCRCKAFGTRCLPLALGLLLHPPGGCCWGARGFCTSALRFARALCICALHEHFAQAHVPLGTTTCLGCSGCFTGGVIVQPWCFRDAQGLGTHTQGFGSWGRVPCLHPKPRHQARIRAPGACGTL